MSDFQNHPASQAAARPPPPPTGPPVGPAGEVVPIERWTTAVQVTIVIGLCLDAVDLALEVFLIRAFDPAGGIPSDSVWDIYDLTAVIALLSLFPFVIAGVAVVVLFWKMMNNGRIIRPGYSQFKSHWALWGWIVPILNFWRPFQVVNQIWGTSHPESVRMIPDAPGVKWWWGAFLASNAVDRVIVRRLPEANLTISDFRVEAIWYAVGDVLTLVSGVLFLVLLHRLFAQQTKTIEQARLAG